MLHRIPEGHFVGQRVPAVVVHAVDHQLRLRAREELVFIREVDDEECAEGREADGHGALDDEDPAPAREAVFPVEEGEAVGEQAREARDHGGREVEDRHALRPQSAQHIHTGSRSGRTCWVS